jgi:FkbM family methyltransferase
MSNIRSSLEAITRNWSFRRRLPSSFGRAAIYVSPSGGLRYLFRSMNNVDPTLLRIVKEVVARDAIVWDVGANVGFFTVAAASAAGPNGCVVAFEPDAWLVQLLRRSARAQSASSAPITVVPAAVASQLAVRKFVLARRSRSTNYLEGYGTSQTGGALETTTVLSVSLDWILGYYPAPTVLKIDVESAELEVLAGAHRLFENARPTVVLEVGAEAAPEVTSFFLQRDYMLYDGEVVASPSRAPLAQATWTTVAVPQQ